MTKVVVQPSGLEYDVKPGDTLMGAAVGLGFYWPTTCGGQGLCTTCLSEVVSGGDLLAEMSRSERKTLISERGESILTRPVRLACQTAVLSEGTVVVSKAGVRGGDI